MLLHHNIFFYCWLNLICFNTDMNLFTCRLIRKLWRSRPNWCCRINACPCDCCNKINRISTEEAKDVFEANKRLLSNFLERERLKHPLGDFTLNEYTEKVIQYGFLMVRIQLPNILSCLLTDIIILAIQSVMLYTEV